MTSLVIAGAGIGGLTAALALAETGMRITLLDRAPILHAVGAGLQLSPNATGVLARLGLLERLAETAVAPVAVRIRRGSDGTQLACLRYGAHAEARYGAPFLVAHRADLQKVLLDAVERQPGVSLATGAGVDGFTADAEQVLVRCGDGTTITADGLIGADGLRSKVRGLLRPDASDDRIYAGRTAWRALVPAERLPKAYRLAFSNLWLGRKLHLVHYPVRGGGLVNVVAVVDERWRGGSPPDLWAVHGDRAQIQQHFLGWTREARVLIDAAPDWRIWPLFDRPPLPRWSHGRVTLMGDAAHPILPFLAQGASQAIEDGWILGQTVRRHRTDLAAAFAAYEAERRPIADRVQRESRRQGMIYHLAPPASVFRDVAMRALGPERMLARYDWLYRRPSVALLS